MDNDNIVINLNWINLDNNDFRILALVSVLAENSLAYRGTLETMCNWLNIKSSAVNNRNIKNSISNLSNNGYIFVNQEGRIYHISITNKGLKEKNVVKLKRQWVRAIREYNKKENNKISTCWIGMLKLFTYIYDKGNLLVTMAELGEILNVSSATASSYLKKLKQCDFSDISIKSEVSRDTITIEIKGKKENICSTRGTDIYIGLEFGKEGI